MSCRFNNYKRKLRSIGKICVHSAMILFLISLVPIFTWAEGSGVAAGQTAPIEKEIPIGMPQIDGIMDYGEWSSSDSILMNENSCTVSPWGGSIQSSAEVYFLWDDNGLYFAADISDPTPSLATENESENILSVDAFQLGLNPGMLISDGHPGVFFTLALSESAENDYTAPIYIIRQNYADSGATGSSAGGEIISEAHYNAAGRITDSGWQFECFLEWNQVNVVGINDQNPRSGSLRSENINSASELTSEKGLLFGFILCYLDRPGNSHNFTTGTGLGFNVENFGGTLTLSDEVIKYTPRRSPAPGTDDTMVFLSMLTVISAAIAYSLKFRKYSL